jgi:hypothetical protein
MVAILHASKLKSDAASFTRALQVNKPTFLSTQLRESAPYLKDAGFRQTATLLLAAADEIETLQARLAADAEGRLQRPLEPLEKPGRAPDAIRFPPSPPNAVQA